MDTNQKPQVELTAEVNAPIKKVWDLINDSEGLPLWNPAMKHVKVVSHQRSGKGEVRECKMLFGKKEGIFTEECIEHVPMKIITHKMVNDTFGMGKMINDFWFSQEVKELSPDKTKYIIKMYYKPKNFFVSIMNALMMRGKMAKDTMVIINKMKETAENN